MKKLHTCPLGCPCNAIGFAGIISMASLLDDKPFMIELNGLHFGPSKKVVRFKNFVESKLSYWPYHVAKAQLPGRLFSPGEICKKLSHHFLLHFPIGMGSYDHHAKYQGVFP